MQHKIWKSIHWVNSKNVSRVMNAFASLLLFTSLTQLSHWGGKNLCCNIKHICVRAWSIITDMRYILLLFCHCMRYTKISHAVAGGVGGGGRERKYWRREMTKIYSITLPGKLKTISFTYIIVRLCTILHILHLQCPTVKIWGKLPVARQNEQFCCCCCWWFEKFKALVKYSKNPHNQKNESKLHIYL